MRKFVLKKIIAGAIAAAITLSTGITAFAADTQQITPGSTGSTTVKANVESEAVIWLPTNITLSGVPDENKKYTGEGAVFVEGDIAGNEFVSVTPESSISLKQSGKDDIMAQVTQEKTTFTYDDIQNANSAITTISADTLSAGEWNSVLHYNVSLEENPLPPGYTTLYEYDLSATEADDVKAYYMVPNKNTSPVEVETQESKVKSRAAVTSAQAASDNIIEYNGIRYELSDEDQLVISGSGKMKENIQADLIDIQGIIDGVLTHFSNISLGTYGDYQYQMDDVSKDYIIHFTFPGLYANDYYPSWIAQKTEVINGNSVRGELLSSSDNFYKEVIAYIDSIVSDYAVSMPKKIVMNNGVENISKYAFRNCNTLQEITIADSVTEIEAYAFSSCDALHSITIPDSVVSLGQNCFEGCKSLSQITFGKGITTIPQYAFRNCSALSSVTFSENLQTVQTYAFYGTPLKEIHINAPITLYALYSSSPIDFYITDINDLIYSNIHNSVNTNNLYMNGVSAEEIVIPDGVEEINNLGFKNIKNVLLPNSVTTIGRYAFSGSSISDLKLPDSVTEIETSAYAGCLNLTVIESLPSQLKNIESCAFENCSNLRKIIIPDSVKNLGSSVFENCRELTDVRLPEGLTILPQTLFAGCSNLKSITIPDSITEVREMAFASCTNLTNVRISDSTLKAIGDSGLLNSVFSGCPCKDALVEHYSTL